MLQFIGSQRVGHDVATDQQQTFFRWEASSNQQPGNTARTWQIEGSSQDEL